MKLHIVLELGDGAAVQQRETRIETTDQLPFALQVGDHGGLYATIIVKEEEQA